MKIINVVHRYASMHGEYGDMTDIGILNPYTATIACLMLSSEVMLAELSKPDKPAIPLPATDDY